MYVKRIGTVADSDCMAHPLGAANGTYVPIGDEANQMYTTDSSESETWTDAPLLMSTGDHEPSLHPL